MTAQAIARLALRELWGARSKWVLPAACIAVAVAAQTSVRHFSSLVDHALDAEARGMAGADLEVGSPRPLPEATREAALSKLPPGTRFTTVKEFVSMSRTLDLPGRTRLVEVRAVSDGFPFYGALEIDPPLPMTALGESSSANPKDPAPAFAQPELLSQLGIQVGDRFALGNQEFRLVALVRREPGPGGSAFALGPRVWIHDRALARTGLETAGSRIRYRSLFAYPASASDLPPKEKLIRADRDRVSAVLTDPALRVRTYLESSPQLRTFFDRLKAFLGVLGLLVLLLSGVGTLSAIRAHLRTRIQVVAILRCLGASRGQILGLFTLQAAGLGLAGSLIGIALAWGTAGGLPRLLGDLLELPSRAPSLLTFGISLAAGIGATCAFALLALVDLPATRPILLLRPDDEPKAPSLPRVLIGGLLLVAFFLAAYAETRSLRLSGAVVGGTLAFFGTSFALFFAALSVLRRALARRSVNAPPIPFSWRYGARNLGRARARNALTLAVLGTATLLLATVSLLRQGMLEELGTASAGSRPQLFLIDVSEEQKSALESALSEFGRFELQWSRLIRARMVSVNGEPVKRQPEDDGVSRSREMNLSERLELYPSERVVDGRFWKSPWEAERDGPDAEVSLAESFARNAQLEVGDRLDFDIQGVPVNARVGSIRRVKWTTFQPNFFVLFRPGALEGAPYQWIASLSGVASASRAEVQSRIARQFPTVTAIDIDEASDRLLRISVRLEAVVRFLSLFTLLAGLGVLAAMALENATARAGEIALLKAVGANRRTILSALAAEYAGIAVLATGLGGAGAWLITDLGLSARFGISPNPLSRETLILLLALCASVWIVGLIASARAFRIQPSELLKSQ